MLVINKTIFFICLFLRVSSLSVDEQTEAIKKHYNKEKNLYMKNQMKVLININDYSMNSDGEIFESNGLIKASKDILFPIAGLFEDWVIDNSMEKIEEMIDELQYRSKALNKEQFFKFLVKLDPQYIFGKYLWNKVKDLDINFNIAKKKSDL